MWRPPEFAGHPASFDAPTWRGYCHQVLDGDTYTVLLDQGFTVYSYQRIRLRGLDCPELSGPGGLAAKQAAETRVFAKPVLLTVHRDERTFERWVADVHWWDGSGWQDLAATLRAEGHVK